MRAVRAREIDAQPVRRARDRRAIDARSAPRRAVSAA
jgi:hypothetical protein